jgi:hypothetical protein
VSTLAFYPLSPMNSPAASSGVSSINVMPVPDLVRDDGSGIQFNFWIPAFALAGKARHGQAGMTARSKLRGINP